MAAQDKNVIKKMVNRCVALLHGDYEDDDAAAAEECLLSNDFRNDFTNFHTFLNNTRRRAAITK